MPSFCKDIKSQYPGEFSGSGKIALPPCPGVTGNRTWLSVCCRFWSFLAKISPFIFFISSVIFRESVVKDNYISYVLKLKIDLDAFKEPDVPKMGLASCAVWGLPSCPPCSARKRQSSGRSQMELTAQHFSDLDHHRGRQAAHTCGCAAVASLKRRRVRRLSLVSSRRNTSDSAELCRQGDEEKCIEDSTPQTSSLWQERRLESGKINISRMDHLSRKSILAPWLRGFYFEHKVFSLGPFSGWSRHTSPQVQ